MADDVGPRPDPGAGAPIATDQDQFVSLYRRFRPGRFGELRGQQHVVRALQGAVRDGRVAHAYLFSGPRGTGKTSTARILARALNCTAQTDGEPCGRCTSCVEIARGASLDVHELDAASNNGVDAMRDLIAHAALATPGRWKVYIVDEVHMLSNAAANALLKTLEEPPGHLVFVLATTDPQKVPPTIRSRTQHFEFGLLGADTLAELVRDVNAAAGLALEDEALSVAVRKGRGSARDALSALDQVAATGSAAGMGPEVVELTEAIVAEDAGQALVAVARLQEAGWGPQQLATELVDDLRQAFLVALSPELCAAVGGDRLRLETQAGRIGLPRLVRCIEVLGRAQVEMRDAPDARAVLEVALVRLARPELDDSSAAILDRLARLEQAVTSGQPAPTPVAALAEPAQSPDPAQSPEPASTAPPEAPVPVPAGRPGGVDPGSDIAVRPGLGALRRQRAATSGHALPDAGIDGPDSPLSPASSRSPAALAPRPPEPPATQQRPPAGPSAEPAPDPDPARAEPAPSAPDRDAVVEAWGDHVLRSLPARPKALFSAGRFVAVEGTVATFALPNAAHRDRCEDVCKVVEDAISSHFGTRLTIRLAVEEGSAEGPLGMSARRRPDGAPADGAPADGQPADLDLDPDDDFDPESPGEPGTAGSIAQAKLLEVFPGAEEVTS